MESTTNRVGQPFEDFGPAEAWEPVVDPIPAPAAASTVKGVVEEGGSVEAAPVDPITTSSPGGRDVSTPIEADICDAALGTSKTSGAVD